MSGCEEYEELLSAWLDGEIEESDAALLMAHLESCPACRHRQVCFRAVNQMVTRFDVPPGPGLEGRIESLVLPKPREPLRRLFSIAVAALVLIAISLVILVLGDDAAASRADERMAALDVMNARAVQEQEALLKAFEWQLKAMKMEVAHSDLDEQNADPLLRRIEGLLEEIENARLDGSKDKGEKR